MQVPAPSLGAVPIGRVLAFFISSALSCYLTAVVPSSASLFLQVLGVMIGVSLSVLLIATLFLVLVRRLRLKSKCHLSTGAAPAWCS